jgi:hypothetical protein
MQEHGDLYSEEKQEDVYMPEANTLTTGIFAVGAQHERELISSQHPGRPAGQDRTGLGSGRERSQKHP